MPESSATAIAIDLGSGSGRVVVGESAGEAQIRLTEVARFPNTPIQVQGHQHWDFPRLLTAIDAGLAKATDKFPNASSVGCDSWAVDYGLVDQNGKLTNLPYCYRDSRTRGMREKVEALLRFGDHYAVTGLPYLPFNSIYQWASEPSWQGIAKVLMIPDLVHHHLCGSEVSEFSNATTTGAFDPVQRCWMNGLLEQLGIPIRAFPEVVGAGSSLGAWDGRQVIAPGTHDTASAVLGVANLQPTSLFINSGTWSLVGCVTPQPIRTPQARALAMQNEGGADGSNRLLKNVMGLWILQELHKEGVFEDYDALNDLPSEPLFDHLFDPDHPSLLSPSSMAQALTSLVGELDTATLLRSVLVSLALKYAKVKDEIESVSNRTFQDIRMVGGGTRINPLNRFTAEACGLPIWVGPVEATALGNCKAQLVGQGIFTWEQARAVREFGTQEQEILPNQSRVWEVGRQRFAEVCP